MQSTDTPERFPLPFANSAGGGYIRPIPTASQIGVTAGRASLTDGFPPDTFIPVGGGGVPPSGRDMNGVLYRLSGWARWLAAGAPVTFDATFAGGVGGYPKGAFLQSKVTPGMFFVSTVENNATDPEGGGASGWQLAVPAKANNGQIDAGVDDGTYITPLGLASLRASPADIKAGTSNSKYLTPAGLAALGSVAGSPGKMVHPNGFIEQWGWLGMYRSGEGWSSLTYPEPFPTAVFNAQIIAINTSGSNQRDLVPQWKPDGSVTTLTFYCQGDGGGGENLEGVSWRVIGN